MSWVSSSTTACATTLVASAARAAGLAGPAVVELSMSSSRRSMRREISACAGKSSRSKSLNALNTGSLNVTVVSSQGCDHRRCTKQAVRPGGTLVARSSTPTSYRTGPPSESQRSCAAALCVRDSLSRKLIMSRPSTVESLFGAAAAIRVACARSGSVWGGTTSKTLLLRLSPRTSMMFGGWSRYPSSRTERPPVASLVGAYDQSVSLYSTRSMGPSRTERTASRSGSTVVRSSLCGHHAPSTYPEWGALGFSRNRGVCWGGVGCRPTLVRSCRGPIVTLLSWPWFIPASVVCAILLPLIADPVVFGDHRPQPRLRFWRYTSSKRRP